MGLIQVGIHENLKLSSDTKVNEHGTVELVIESAGGGNAVLAAFTANTTFSPMKSSLRFYPPNMTTFDKTVKTSTEIAADLLKMRYQFTQYALLFATKEKVEAAIGGLEMFKGLGIPDDQLPAAIERLTNEEFTHKVCTNLGTKFVAFLAANNAYSSAVPFRQKFLRQSKDKNYAIIPNSDYDTWIESMQIPKSASKIAYSKWEIENKKNDPAASIGDAPEVKADVNKAKNLFGGATAATTTEAAKPATTSPDQPDLG